MYEIINHLAMEMNFKSNLMSRYVDTTQITLVPIKVNKIVIPEELIEIFNLQQHNTIAARIEGNKVIICSVLDALNDVGSNEYSFFTMEISGDFCIYISVKFCGFTCETIALLTYSNNKIELSY